MPASWRQNRTGAFLTRGVRIEHGAFIGRLRSAPQPKHRFMRNSLLVRLCGASLLVKVGSFPARVHGGDGALTGILPRAVDPPEGGSFRTGADKTEAALEKTASDPLAVADTQENWRLGSGPLMGQWCRGTGTHVVRMVRNGQKCWVGKRTLCCVYRMCCPAMTPMNSGAAVHRFSQPSSFTQATPSCPSK